MRCLMILALSVGLVLPGAPARARDVLRLQPSTPWNLHYAEENCRLARRFGEGRQQVTLVLNQFEPGDGFSVMLFGEQLRPRRSRTPFEAELRFGPNEAESEISVETGKMDDGQPALLINGEQRIAPLTKAEMKVLHDAWRDGRRVDVAPIGPAREAAATWLSITDALRTDIVLETGSMAEPLAALRNCSWETIRHWGLDVEQQKALTRRPHPKTGPHTWLDSDDYPVKMLNSGFEGNVHFRLLVDATGKPTSCRIQLSTHPKEFDDVVCEAAMKRARFEPALDTHGRPVPSYWRRTVRFRFGF